MMIGFEFVFFFFCSPVNLYIFQNCLAYQFGSDRYIYQYSKKGSTLIHNRVDTKIQYIKENLFVYKNRPALVYRIFIQYIFIWTGTSRIRLE